MKHLADIERIATASLGDKNGYVSAIGTEILARIGTPTAHAEAIRFSPNAVGTTRCSAASSRSRRRAYPW